LDGVYDCGGTEKPFSSQDGSQYQREPPRRRSSKRGRKPLFNPAIFKERFNTIERVLAGKINFAACCFGSNASAICTTPSSFGLYDDQPSALLPGLNLQAMGFMMVALRQHCHVRQQCGGVHCGNYFGYPDSDVFGSAI